MLSTPEPMTREEMKALPIALLSSSRYGSFPGQITLLSFHRHNRHIDRLYALMPDLRRHYRAVIDDPVKSYLTERHLRSVWSRLVDRSRGYWINGGAKFTEYADYTEGARL